MVNVRTIDELEAALTEELKWRTREVAQWEAVAGRARIHELPAVLRGGFAILYAHWEGFIKTAASYYLQHVAKKGLNLGDLRAELAAVALRGALGKGESSKNSSDHTAIVLMLREGDATAAKIPYDRAAIRTFSNLTFERFADIMHSIGCDSDRHAIHRGLINLRLLKNRNDIAHGREQYIQLEDWQEMRKRVFDILKDVRMQISNAASSESYKRLP